MSGKRTMFVTIVFCLLACPFGRAVELEYSTRENTMQWFEGARFGIFVHWDARSNWASADGDYNVDIRPSMKRAQEAAVWDDALDARGKPSGKKRWQTWNPQKFNAEEWVRLFLEAEAKYFTFTTMHSFSFSNFDHPATRFDVMSTPYGKNLAAQLAQAAQGKIPVMWYHNMYPSKHVTKERWEHFKTFLEPGAADWDRFRKAGIHELVRNTEKYGKAAGIWCDGGGTFAKNAVNRDFYRGMQEAQPWLIFSPRCGHADVPKDWRVPEQRMPAIDWDVQQEMTLPLESSLWFWSQGKAANTKDAEYCIQTLIQTAARDANLLLNISPRGDGAIDPSQAEVLRGIGKWLRRYGRSIFETRGGPYEPGRWGGCTRRGDTIYLHLTQLSGDGKYQLPALPLKILSSRMLNGHKVQVRQSREGVEVEMDVSISLDPEIIDRIVELKVAGDAWAALPEKTIAVATGKALAATASASSENTYQRPSGKSVTDAAANVTAGERGEWTAAEPWSEAGADSRPWLQLDLAGVRAFREISLQEQHSRIVQYVIEYKEPESGSWETLFSGGRLNHFSYKLARPVRSQAVRIRLLKTSGGAPQIREFAVYG